MTLNPALLQGRANRLKVAPLEQQLRAVSSFNRAASQISFAGSGAFQTFVAARVIHRIGSGAVSEISVVVPNWSVANSGIQATGNTFDVMGMYLENLDTGVSVQVKFSGSATVTVADLTTIRSDPIKASAFGLESFPINARLALREIRRLPLSGILPQITRIDSNASTCSYYDGSTVSCTNLSGTGPLTFSGSTTPTFAPSAMLVGKFVSGDPRTWIGIGDSILEGAGDSPGVDTGAGYFTRALRAGQLAGINMGKPSGGGTAWAGSGFTYQPLFYDLQQYVSGAVCEYGTNNFDASANGNASNRTAGYTVEWGLMNFLHQFMSVKPGQSAFKIIRALLMPRCTSSGFSDATPAGQTVLGPKWDAGGDADLWNTQMAADVGVFNRADYLFDPSPYTRASLSGRGTANADYYKWAAGTGSLDGTHPGTSCHTACGGGLSALMLSVP